MNPEPIQTPQGPFTESKYMDLASRKITFWEPFPSKFLADGSRESSFKPEFAKSLLPGSFNPLHKGHLQIAELAEQRLGKPCWLELSLVNADKPALDFHSANQRLSQDFRNNGLLITSLPTFLEKAKAFPNSVFLVGADTIERIDDCKYYEEEPSKRDQAIKQIGKMGCSFLVFARKIDDVIHSSANIRLSETARDLCEFVSEAEFLMDLSSTEIRNRERNPLNRNDD